MTTAPPRPIPTPLDLANRQADRDLAAGVLERPEGDFLTLWHRGILRSGLPPHFRLVALALAARADHATGQIPADQQPYLGGLVLDTRLTDGQVVVALNALRSRGWVQVVRTGRPHGHRYTHCHLRLRILTALLPSLTA